jgi:Glycosyl hydrolase family 12
LRKIARASVGLFAAVAVAVPATLAAVSTVSASTNTTCTQYAHIKVSTSWGAHFVVRNDNWGDTECLSNTDLRTNFKVTKSSASWSTPKVKAFPDIYRGCSWGVCTWDSKLPRKVSALDPPITTWYTSENAPGTWNAAYDIWFTKSEETNGQANGAELMIWLNTHNMGRPPAGTPTLWVRHHKYWFLHWVPCHNGACWNYIQFRRVRTTWGVRRMRIGPFIRRAERRGLIRSWWWMENIEAGFEIWTGGTGLTTKWFWARE